MKILLALLMMLGTFSFAHAETTSGTELAASCRLITATQTKETTSDDLQEAAHCLGIVQGVMDTLGFWNVANTKDKLSTTSCACMPETMSVLQAIKVFLRYIDAHPGVRNEPGSVLTARALIHAYPCKT
jgi:hypothetical protein